MNNKISIQNMLYNKDTNMNNSFNLNNIVRY
jgi:hypothetical protein